MNEFMSPLYAIVHVGGFVLALVIGAVGLGFFIDAVRDYMNTTLRRVCTCVAASLVLALGASAATYIGVKINHDQIHGINQ